MTGATEKAPELELSFGYWGGGKKERQLWKWLSAPMREIHWDLMCWQAASGTYPVTGRVWGFGGRGAEAVHVRTLQVAPALPQSEVTRVPHYPLPAAAKRGISEAINDVEKREIISHAHSPSYPLVWPVRESDERWRLAIDYRRLNRNTPPLTSAIPSIT